MAKKKAVKAEKEPAAAGVPEGGERITVDQKDMASVLKEIESAVFAVKFYPVAVNEGSKDEAIAKLEGIYASGSETVRQMLIYTIHENLSASIELKTMHTLEYFKMKGQGADPAQQRMNVYRAIFNYNTSLEGLLEFIRMLGRMRGSDDAVKLLTYHYSHLCSVENEASHVLRNAMLESLGSSESKYALLALLDYAEYTDSERSFSRIVSALSEWEDKLGPMKMPAKEKGVLMERLKKIVTSDFGGSHYG
jgi:hypothetical protein